MSAAGDSGIVMDRFAAAASGDCRGDTSNCRAGTLPLGQDIIGTPDTALHAATIR